MVNRVVIVGRLTTDPELRRTNSGTAVTSFTIAFQNRTKNADGTTSSSFVNCSAWNKTAEVVADYCKKGSQIAIDGRLQERKYQRRDGTNASIVEIVVENVELLGKKSSTDDKDVGYSQDINSNNDYEKNDNVVDEIADDDLPF